MPSGCLRPVEAVAVIKFHKPTTHVPTIIEFETSRLYLRQWREQDREPFAAMNADPAVMEFFPSFQNRALSGASIDTWQLQLANERLEQLGR